MAQHALSSPFVRDQLLARTVDLNGKRHSPDGLYVLYWMQATHRLTDNWALRAAVRAANKFNRPLIVHQGLDPTYPYAAARHHEFILQGARDTARNARALGFHYQFGLRARRDDDRRVVDRLAAKAYLVITDLFPTAGVRERSERFALRAPCRVLAVDSSCVVPSGIFLTPEFAARTIRPKIGRLLPHAMEPVLDETPRVPVSRALHDELRDCMQGESQSSPSDNATAGRNSSVRRNSAAQVNSSARAQARHSPPSEWLELSDATNADIARVVARCEINHSVTAVASKPGGSEAAQRALNAFISRGLGTYNETRNNAGLMESTSELSPYLHFGQLSSVQAVRMVHASVAPAESVMAFVQQITTWRELSFNWCLRTRAYDQIAALPEWIQKTMAAHVGDARPVLYDLETLERGETHDAFWNAAQHQLRETGVIHNYARMLWGKMLLLWSPDYETARERMFYLNDKWALDGRDPNSVGGIMWCLGLWDRPWGNKPVWGGIRPMLTSRVKLKFDTKPYIERWSRETSLL